MNVIARSKVLVLLPAAGLVLAMLAAMPGCDQNNEATDPNGNANDVAANADSGTGSNNNAPRSSSAPVSHEQALLSDALFQAILDGDEADAISLVEEGASVHAEDHRGISVMHYAARATMPTLTRVLLEHGARVDVPFENNQQPIHWAARAGASDRPGSKETIDVLLEYGADINARSDAGTTPISYAVQLGNVEWQDFMLSRGAVLN